MQLLSTPPRENRRRRQGPNLHAGWLSSAVSMAKIEDIGS